MSTAMPAAGDKIPTPDMTETQYHTFRASVEEVVNAGELLVEVDLGFSIRTTVCVSLFGVGADAVHRSPDDSAENRRGTDQRDFVKTWLGIARSSYSGSDGMPLSLTTLRSREGDPTRYEGIVFSRATEESLNDQLRQEFPGASEL